MLIKPQHFISNKAAISLLQQGLPVTNASVKGAIAPAVGEDWDQEISIENCILEKFDGSVTQFNKPVNFINCHVKDCAFIFAYFLQGLRIENCTFDSYLDFQAGGHNAVEYPVIIKNNQFDGFVNFFDCWYKGEVAVCDNVFSKGTNIDSKNQLITFDSIPILLGNHGPVAVEAEF